MEDDSFNRNDDSNKIEELKTNENKTIANDVDKNFNLHKQSNLIIIFFQIILILGSIFILFSLTFFSDKEIEVILQVFKWIAQIGITFVLQILLINIVVLIVILIIVKLVHKIIKK